MVSPKVVSRDEHGVSRSLIDADALKVLYRLHQHGFRAYLVGGGVRDLLLGRRPKDFDVGTDAHPYQIKKLFRNCWIIGRRFRLAHVRFGPNKVVEVATFRRLIVPGTEAEPAVVPAEVPDGRDGKPEGSPRAPTVLAEGITLSADRAAVPPDASVRMVHDDNTFGTPEEDAFRRDFTINALFYDIGSRTIIDYTGGIDDLRAGLVRCIGNPDERFVEDPVRMMRAVVFSSRLGFRIDPPVVEAIGRNRAHIEQASPARVLEELYKILRSGSARRTFAALAEVGLLRHIAPQIPERLPAALGEALERLDSYRTLTTEVPPNLTNAILLGTLLVPLGLMSSRPRRPRGDADGSMERTDRGTEAGPVLGRLPLARRDVERIGHLLTMQARLVEMETHPRRQRSLVSRPSFDDAITWLDVHGVSPEVVEFWHQVITEQPVEPAVGATPKGSDPLLDDEAPRRPPRRRRRGRRRP